MSASRVSQVTLDDLQRLVGEGNAWEGTPEDAVEGKRPRFVAEPGSAEEAAAVLQLADRLGLAVAPRGGGTKLEWGAAPARLDLVLSTRRMDRVLEHASGDLVARVQAGTTLRALQRSLAGARQRLALDPPEKDATVGGIVAANSSGPLRLRYGTVRDLIIGITFALPDGTVARAGSKVVKNVAGYDLAKLFTGSLGTLGLIVEVIFRLHPIPAARRIVRCSLGEDPATAAGGAVQALLHSTLVPSAVELDWASDTSITVLFEGIEAGVEAQARRAVELMEPFGSPEVLDGEPGAERGGQELPPERAELKITFPIAELSRVLSELEDVLGPAGGAGWQAWGHAASGVLFLSVEGEPHKQVDIIEQLRTRMGRLGGYLVVRRARPEVKERVDVWGPVGDALPLMRSVKGQFDPNGVLNPGRFVGGI